MSVLNFSRAMCCDAQPGMVRPLLCRQVAAPAQAHAGPATHLLATNGEANHGHPVAGGGQLAKPGKRGVLPKGRIINSQEGQVTVTPHSHDPCLVSAVVGATLHLDLQQRQRQQRRGVVAVAGAATS